MTRLRPREGKRALPWGLLGMLCMVVVIELGLAHDELNFKHCFTYDWVVTGRWARQRTLGCEILCFGDSLVKYGISPRMLEERLGQRAFNLAVCGGQAPSSYFLLRRALDSGARPRSIVVDFMPHLLAHGPRQNERQWPELLDVREFVDLIRTTHNASFLAGLATSWLTPSAKSRFEIRESLLAAFRGETLASHETLLKYERVWETHQGASLGQEASRSPRKYNLSRWEDFPRAWSCNPVNAVYLRRFLKLAQSHGIQVLWLLPPVSPEAQERRERIGIEDRHLQFVRQVQSEYANLTVVDGRHAGFDGSVFLDPLHLDRHGAVALSASLAEVIAETRSNQNTDRWVELPPPTTFAVDLPSDAADPSKLAMRTQALKRQ
jgi:hypothetical protein